MCFADNSGIDGKCSGVFIATSEDGVVNHGIDIYLGSDSFDGDADTLSLGQRLSLLMCFRS